MLLLWARGCGQRHHTHAHSFILVFVHYYWSCRFYYNSICHCFHIWRTFRVAVVTIWNVHPKTSMCVQVQLIIFCFGICLDTPLACPLSVSGQAVSLCQRNDNRHGWKHQQLNLQWNSRWVKGHRGWNSYLLVVFMTLWQIPAAPLTISSLSLCLYSKCHKPPLRGRCIQGPVI